jgi:hypothetical protein
MQLKLACNYSLFQRHCISTPALYHHQHEVISLVLLSPIKVPSEDKSHSTDDAAHLPIENSS